jgi:hypothetical protein
VRELRERRRAISGENYIIAEPQRLGVETAPPSSHSFSSLFRHFGLAENSCYVEELFFFRLLLFSLSLSLSLSYFLWTSIPHRLFLLFQVDGKRRAAAASILHRPFTLFQACGKRAIAAAHNRKREEIVLFTRRKKRESKKKKKKTKKVCGERVLQFEVRRSFNLHFAFCLCNNRDFVRQESVC